MYNWLSASDLAKLVQAAGLKSLPTTDRAISMKAERDRWVYEKVDGKGGPGGKKTIYQIPNYVIDELREKGLLHLIEEGAPAAPEEKNRPSERPVYKENPVFAAEPLPEGMEALVKNYRAWAAAQNTGGIVPVRYHINVYGSAGNGTVAWQAEETEAMWFRASFFQHLGVNPNRCFCTRVKGDSMFPTLIDLGTALWYATARYTEEGIYLFRQYDEIRIKRLQRLNAHTFNIISDNANKGIYPTTELDLTRIETHDFEILGRYLWSCGISR